MVLALAGTGRTRPFQDLLILALGAAVSACAPALPGAGGAQPAAPSPAEAWIPPAASIRENAGARLPPDSLPPELAARRNRLTPTDLILLALERRPETRASWAQARATAAVYGEARGQLFPEIDVTVGVNRLKTAATGGRVSVQQTTYGPSLTLSWLLFDFGGRSGNLAAARDALFAANWTHNATLADLVRRTSEAYYAYVGSRGLLEAQQATLQQAEVNLAAAEDRRRVGVATIVDALQARTAAAQARLGLQSAEGAVTSSRGALATLIGLPPTAQFEVDTLAASGPVAQLSETVDSLIAEAVVERPELAAERAFVEQRRAQARSARANALPSLRATGTGSNVYVTTSPGAKFSYNLGIELSIPIFNGLGWEYAARAAALSADAESARLETQQSEVALEVFQTYQELRTATERVVTADELFSSAAAAAEATRARYREGVGTLLELLTAESALSGARAERVQSRVQWHTSLVQLAFDAGLLQPRGATPIRLAPLPATPVPPQ